MQNNMKVALGSKTIKGPWGGGNLFTINLEKYLKSKDIEVINNLTEPGIDIILLTEPRLESSTSTITLLEARLYKKFVNSQVKIIHRVNECDERKNTNFVNKKMISISNRSDFTIYVSSWIQDLFNKNQIQVDESKVIMSGSNNRVFNKINKEVWDRKSKLRIVTHHWGNNWNKGFDSYSYLDTLLDDLELREKFNFTYIGNLPKDFKFRNSDYLKPISDLELSNELKTHDLYITGSINEPSGNHHIEGALCGLPVLYVKSGGVTEYQSDYGIEFKDSDLLEKLNNIYMNYEVYYQRNKNFPFSSDRMCKEYFDVMLELCSIKKKKRSSLYLILYRLFYPNLISYYKDVSARTIYHFRKITDSANK